MNLFSKSILYFNTVKYLKPTQLIYQVINRLRPKDAFIKYQKKNVNYSEYDIWIKQLDENEEYSERFLPDELLKNQLTLLHETRAFDRWKFPDASHLWNFNLHYLEYLVALKSRYKKSSDEKYKKKLNEILNDWYERGLSESDSNHPYTISLRIINLLLIADVITDKQKLYDSIYAQYRFLLKHQEKHLLGNHYLENLKAIVVCSLIFNQQKICNKYIKRLLKEIEEQITSDGLHFELSLMYHKIVLEDLIRVAVILKQAGKDEYEQLVAYIRKMTTALNSLEAGINRTPLFNDSGDNVAKTSASLLEACKTLFGIEPEQKSNIAGYYKLYDEHLTLIADGGKSGPEYMPGHAHCDCLSYELFYNGKPLFVNSGTYQYQGETRRYFRSTKAHNTVEINNHEQSELWGEHRAARRINNIKVSAEENKIIGQYKNYSGELHQRTIELNNQILKVTDKTAGAAKSYLHLVPGLVYSDGKISGNGISINVKTINSQITVEQGLYASDFGKKEENTVLVFNWNKDKQIHGYEIEITKGE